MNRTFSILVVAAAAGTLALGAWAATPPTSKGMAGDAPDHRRDQPYSLERVALRNLVVKQLAQRSGQSEAKIGELLQSQPPHAVAETLGLDRAAMKDIFTNARTTLIDDAVQAQMITAAQADELKSAPPPRRFGHDRTRGADDQGPRGPADSPPPDDEGE
ncbi:MAG: hypothetical protein WC809_13605 [Sinimarinibacterium sp.]|jgi:hypothetical protein